MVEWKKLGDICEIIRGNGVQKTDFVESGVGCIHYGQIYTHYGPFTYTTNKFVSKEVFEKARKASKGDIIMTDTSENVEDICKSVAYLGEEDIAVSNHALILKHKQNPKFLTYSTLTNSFLNQKRKYVVGAKVSGIKPEKLAQIKIYLPSLPEQQRIVEQLDTFTSSIENLKEQIAQRRKQYEYYRDQLLDLEGKEGVEMKTLGDICTKITDGSHFSPQAVEQGYYMPSVKDMRNNGFDYSTCKQISEEDFENLVNNGCKPKLNDVLIAKDGSMLKYVFPVLEEKSIVVLSSIAILTPKQEFVNSKYLSYYLIQDKIKDKTIREFSSKGGVPRIILKNFKKVIILYPSLSEQQRIVSILDTFEASINNLEQKLALREKQYDYYRNKLLTFE